jgi:hypothetical protein
LQQTPQSEWNARMSSPSAAPCHCLRHASTVRGTNPFAILRMESIVQPTAIGVVRSPCFSERRSRLKCYLPSSTP